MSQLITPMNRDLFLERVTDYTRDEQWTYRSEKPCIIDFYDDTCPPCKIAEQILTELAETYAGKIDFYKVDTRAEKALSKELGVDYLPTIVICPVDDKPIVLQGAPDKKKLVDAITKISDMSD